MQDAEQAEQGRNFAGCRGGVHSDLLGFPYVDRRLKEDRRFRDQAQEALDSHPSWRAI
jgi:hypothetical protein